MHFEHSPRSTAPVLSERIELAESSEREALKDVVGKFGMPQPAPATQVDLSFQAPPAPLPDGHVEVIGASAAKVEAAAECITLRLRRSLLITLHNFT